MKNDTIIGNQNIQFVDIQEIEDVSFFDPKDVAVIMPCTDADLGMKTAQILLRRAGMPCLILVVNDSRRQGFIKTVNESAARITAKYIVYLAQDAWPGRDWLRCAFETLEKNGKGLLAFNDGKWKGRIAAFGMVRTGWVQPFYNGGVFFPDYISHAADNELTVIARALDMHVYNPECTLMEYDPEKDAGGGNPADKILFKKRFINGFDGLIPIQKLEPLADEYKIRWQPTGIEHGVSVVILTQNRGEDLNHLLEGFFTANTHSPIELIIIDHGSSDNTAQVAARFVTRGFIRMINRGKRESFAGSVRMGADKARYPWLLFLRDDISYVSNIIPHVLDKLKEKISGVAGVRLNDDFENLTVGFELTAFSLNRFQLLFCHKKKFEALEDSDKIFRMVNKQIRHSTALTESAHPSPLSGFCPDINEPDRVNIVLYTSGELDILRRGLLSLRHFTDLRKNTLFLIDDSQNSYVAEKILEWTRDFDFVEQVKHPQKIGFCNAIRALVTDVKWGDFCVITEAAVLTPGWLANIKKAAYTDRRIGMVSPVTNTHPLYSFRMNPGDNISTCAKKLSLVSAHQYPVIHVPDTAIFYLKQTAVKQNPLPVFRHKSLLSYFLEYTARLAESGKHCILADDTFVFVTCRAVKSRGTNVNQPRRKPRPELRDCGKIINNFGRLKPVSLENYAASDIRLDPSRTLAVFFHGIGLGGGTLVLVEFCNDLILKGWNVVGILLNKRQKKTAWFDLLFEPYPGSDAHEISSRLGRHSFLMATFWNTARPVSRITRLNDNYIPFYFIQDFEVMFYNPQNDSANPKEKEYQELAAESYRFDFYHLTTSDWIAARVRSFLSQSDHCIRKLRIGFNPELFYPETGCRRKQKPLRIIAMARPRTPRRGFKDLVITLAIVHENRPDVEIFLFGSSDLSEFEIPFPFHNLGIVSPKELRKQYNAAHIYLDASLFQGYGLTGLEAMACGCSCVLTDSGGAAEYAENKKNVLFVPPGDPGVQARAVLSLINDEALRKNIAANAVAAARKFSIHHAADDFEEIAGPMIAERDAAFEHKCADSACNIIVPIFNQISAVRNCLESIEACTDHPYRVILVDDCSDNHTASYLKQFAAGHADCVLVRNEQNLGFVCSVNAGLQTTVSGDIVLLNSDTIVTPGWLTGLVRCAASDPDIGVVSPLTTRSSHLWIRPNPGETIFETARNIKKSACAEYPDVVTPEGWCFYIKRRVYETLGGFDPVYGRGYCEESDYSMRAMANGWRTVCCDDTFIFHEGMVTFKEQRGARYRQNRKIFDRRWKYYYQKEYEAFLTRNPLGRLRLWHKALAPSAWKDPANGPVDGKRNILDMIPEVAPAEVIRRYRRQIEDPVCRARLRQKGRENPRTIVFLIQQMESYGGVLSVVRLANDLIQMGLDVKVVVLTSKNYTEFPGLLTRPVYFEDHVSLIENFPAADIVVSTLWTTVYFSAALFSKKPDFLPLYFVQDYEPDFYSVSERKIRKRIEDTYHLIPYAFAKTPWICRKVEALGARITEVPPALDLDLFYPRDVNHSDAGLKKIILTLLRPRTPQRGFETAVCVLKRLNDARSDIEIHTFGCEDRDLKQHGFSLPAVNHGIVANSDLPDLYSRAHLFVEFSNFHGFGRTIAEAMACGCACVVTDSGGISLFTRHEENALIAPPQDIHKLFELINRLCDDENLRQHLAANARSGVLQFAHLHSARKTLEFFRQCLTENLDEIDKNRPGNR